MVRQREQQHEVLLEAVQNLNPDVVLCDEIGTKQVGGQLAGSRHVEPAGAVHACIQSDDSCPPSEPLDSICSLRKTSGT